MVYEGAVRIVNGLLGIGLAVFAGSTYVVREIPALLLALTVMFSKMRYRPAFRKEILQNTKYLFASALPLGLAGIMVAAGQRLDGIFMEISDPPTFSEEQ